MADCQVAAVEFRKNDVGSTLRPKGELNKLRRIQHFDRGVQHRQTI